MAVSVGAAAVRRGACAILVALAGCASTPADQPPQNGLVVRSLCLRGELLGFEISATGTGVALLSLNDLPGCPQERPTRLPPQT
jgi:hypothetical protein